MSKPARKHKTMKAAQAACRRLRDKGDKISMRKAEEIEESWFNHPDYMSDHDYIGVAQAGKFSTERRRRKVG